MFLWSAIGTYLNSFFSLKFISKETLFPLKFDSLLEPRKQKKITPDLRLAQLWIVIQLVWFVLLKYIVIIKIYVQADLSLMLTFWVLGNSISMIYWALKYNFLKFCQLANLLFGRDWWISVSVFYIPIGTLPTNSISFCKLSLPTKNSIVSEWLKTFDTT